MRVSESPRQAGAAGHIGHRRSRDAGLQPALPRCRGQTQLPRAPASSAVKRGAGSYLTKC